MQRIATLTSQGIRASHYLGNHGPPRERARESSPDWERVPAGGSHNLAMPRAARDPGQDLRLIRFGRFVRDELEKAAARGMTIKQIEETTGVSKSTFYRWRDAGVVPAVEQVRSFCAGLGASLADAYAALGWSEQTAARPKRDQLIDDPDLRRLLHKLNNPKTPAAEKLLIRRTVRALAAAPEEPHPEE